MYRESPVGLSRLPTCHFCILQMILGTVTCRQFLRRRLSPALTFAPRKTCFIKAATSRFTAINVTASINIHHSLYKINRKNCIFSSTIQNKFDRNISPGQNSILIKSKSKIHRINLPLTIFIFIIYVS